MRQYNGSLHKCRKCKNSMNDSAEFHEVESNHCGRFSHVPNQQAAIPSSRSMLSRDKCLPPDTCNTSGPHENVFGNQSSTFDSSQNHPQGIHHQRHQERKDEFHKWLGQGPLSQETTSELRSQFQCRHLEDSKDSRYRNCNSTSSQHPHFYFGR